MPTCGESLPPPIGGRLPHADGFSYRPNIWPKAELPPRADERTRTGRAVNLRGGKGVLGEGKG